MTPLINLQHSPNPSNLVTEAVTFQSNEVTLKGTVYKLADTTEPQAGIIVTGAWTTVKEQMAGTYARELAAQGFTTLAFDFTGWGESEGSPRFVENPAMKTADIHAAATFMAGRDDVDANHLTGLGICASAGYMAAAVADHPQLSQLVLVAPWLHNPALAADVYGGADMAAKLIAASETAEALAEPTVLTAASVSDDSAPMYGAPYYTEPQRGLIREYDNRFSTLSWKPWLTYDAQASAERLLKPTLMVGSEGMALPAGAEAYQQHTSAPLKKVWFGEEVNQFDFYDREDIVQAAIAAIVEFAGNHRHAE